MNGSHDGVPADLRPASARQSPDAAELPAEVFHAAPRDLLEEMIARELAAAGEVFGPGGPKSGVAGAVLAAGAIAARSGPPALAPDTDAEAKARQRASFEAAERDGEDDDTGLGASLVLSVIKDSALAELARNVTAGGAVALSAGSTPFFRVRARGAPESAGVELGGALEIGEADATEAVVLAAVEDAAGEGGLAHDDLAADYRDALRSVGAGDLVLATAARHDLVGEASGGAERGTAVTAATPIDVASTDADADLEADATFTLAVLSDAAPALRDGVDAIDAPDGGLSGLALSTHLPALAFEYFVGGGRDAAIRSGDSVAALVGEPVIAVSGLLDPAAVAPLASAHGHDVTDLVDCLDEDAGDGQVEPSADLPIGDSREVVIAYLGALAAPIAGSAGLTRVFRGGDRLRGAAPGQASRAALDGRSDAVRGGGSWAERFVNDLGVAAEDPNPNAKIKIKL